MTHVPTQGRQSRHSDGGREGALAIIPARGGSKGIPRKNLMPVAGAPLIAHTIRQALAAQSVGRVVVSTDSEDIASVAMKEGAEFVMRPAAISGDHAQSELALAFTLDTLLEREGHDPEVVVFLQCTSPVRGPRDIDNAVTLLEARQADSVLSVVSSHKFFWVETENGAIPINYKVDKRPRRQDMTPQFIENGSIYVFRSAMFRQTGNRLGGKIALYEMSDASSVDIDTVLDARIAEILLVEGREGDGPQH